MINQQLLDYIKKQLEEGASEEQLKIFLMASGWQEKDINEAFSLLLSRSISQPTQQTSNFYTNNQSTNQPIIKQVENKISQPIQDIAKNIPTPDQNRFFSSQTEINNFSTSGRKKILIPIVFITIGVLIFGGGVFAYFNYFQSPQKNIQKMLNNLKNVKSLELDGEIKAKINTQDVIEKTEENNNNILSTVVPKETGEINFLIKFNAKGEFQDDANKSKSALSLEINLDIPQEEKINLKMETRQIDKVGYIKLINLSGLGPLTELFDLNSFKNKWIKIDAEELEKKFGPNKEEVKKETKKQEELSQELIEKIKTILTDVKIIKEIKKMPNEKIEGINSYHYKSIIDKNNFIKLLEEILKTQEGFPSITKEELESFKEIDFSEIDIWIGKKDLLPYKISFGIIFNKNKKEIGNISVLLLPKNFNEPIIIEVPPKAKPLEELLNELLIKYQTILINTLIAGTNPKELNKDSDKDGLPDLVEKFYGTNPKKADTDEDGIKDKEEIEKGLNPNGPGTLFDLFIKSTEYFQ